MASLVSCSGPTTTESSDDFGEHSWLASSIARIGKPLEGAVQELDRGVKLTPRAAGALAVLLDRESGAFEVQTRSGGVRVTREGGPWSIRSSDETTVHMGRKQGDIDVRFFALHDRIEELVRVPSRAAKLSYRFELSPGQRLIQRHPAVPAVDVVEGAGVTTLRMAAPKLWDRDGEEFPIALSLEGDRVVLEAPEGARFPVVMDPVWLSANEMSRSRSVHTATLLLNGKVLLAGGAGEANRSAELYDPDLDSYEPLPTLTDTRIAHTATLLRNGKVLIAGGFYYVVADPDPRKTAELFDPETGAFESTGDLVHARGRHSATLLGDGRVLLVAGQGLYDAAVTEAEVYDPETGRFESVGSPIYAGLRHAAARLADGTVALVWHHPTDPPRIELFDPATDTFVDPGIVFPPDDLVTGADPAAFRSPTTDELVVRTSAHSCNIDLVTTAPSCQLVDVDLQYGPGLNGAPQAISQLGETIFAFGGTDPGGRSIQRYAPESDTPWEDQEEAANQESHTSTALPGASVLVTGGLSDPDSIKLFFDPGSFRAVVENPALLPLISAGHATTLLVDGRILITGGTSGSLAARAQDGLDAPQTLGTLLAKRHGHRAILLDSGKVLVAGGETDPADAPEELFDPSTGVSTALDFRLSARSNAVTMPGGRVLFAGPSGLQVVDTESWSVVGEYSIDLFCVVPGLARLPSGRVAVVAEGFVFTVGPGLQDASPQAALQSPRCNPVVVALPDGWSKGGDVGPAVLVAGGDEEMGTSELADVFYPETPRVQFQMGVPAGAASVPGFLAFGRVNILSASSANGLDAAAMSYRSLENTGEWVNRIASSSHFGMRAGSTVTRLVDGGFLTAGVRYSGEPTALLWGWSGAKFRLSKPLLRVRPGQEIDLEDLPFSTTWAEGSSGTTKASPADAPIPVWTPASDGWPVAGTFLSWSEKRARWRVPNTPFAGIGFLSYVLHGTQHPLMPVEIRAAEIGAACETNSECESGFCADGVCCESVCNAPCESCSAALKTEGEDGTCGPSRTDRVDSACELEDVRTCGQNGQCDGASACALYAEGTSCSDQGAVCVRGLCTIASVCNETDSISISDGIETSCRPYRCDRVHGACLTDCATSRDCADGYDCDAEGECSPSSELPHYSLGCIPGCRVADRGHRSALTLAAILGLVISARARRRSRSQAWANSMRWCRSAARSARRSG